MKKNKYFMENDDEIIRLDFKTDSKVIIEQAKWAGIEPGMRIADIGFGSGKGTYYLNTLVQPEGETIGIDCVEDRIQYAKEHYMDKGITYVVKDVQEPLDDIGMFDFIWVRFVLEYYRSESFDIVKNISKALKPGGILCLVDLDLNSMIHYGHSKQLAEALEEVVKSIEKNFDFDPYIGRKLYSYLYDMKYDKIDVKLEAHHLIYGGLNNVDAFNWSKKVEVAAKNSGYDFKLFDGGFEGFVKEFQSFFFHPRRFTYTPVILCKGHKLLL